MTSPAVTVIYIYAALCGLLLFALSLNVSRTRGKYKVSLGDGGHEELMRAIRAQGNFVEYTPLVLLLLLLLELKGAPVLALHILGAGYFVSRVLHGLGMIMNARPNPMRGIGAGVTWLVLIIASVWLLAIAFTHPM